jgi:hypothetical protein
MVEGGVLHVVSIGQGDEGIACLGLFAQSLEQVEEGMIRAGLPWSRDSGTR